MSKMRLILKPVPRVKMLKTTMKTTIKKTRKWIAFKPKIRRKTTKMEVSGRAVDLEKKMISLTLMTKRKKLLKLTQKKNAKLKRRRNKTSSIRRGLLENANPRSNRKTFRQSSKTLVVSPRTTSNLRVIKKKRVAV